MSTGPFTTPNYVREVLIQTAAQWALNGDLVLQSYQTARNIDDGREKTGDGDTIYADLPYDAPSGQVYNLPTGTPGSDDLVAYNAITAAAAAEGSMTATDQGTVGAVIIVGNKLYEIVASGATGDQIDQGADEIEYGSNIADKVTTDTADTLCTATDDGAGVVTFTANDDGLAGNEIPLSTNDPNIDPTVAFAGGLDQVNVLKASLVSDFGGGTGDVVGPASAVSGHAVAFDGTTGKLIEDAGMAFPASSGVLGYLGLPQNSQSADYTLALTDAGKDVFHPSGAGAGDTFTIPKNATIAFPVDASAMSITNMDSNDLTVEIDTDTLNYVDVGPVTSITIPQYNKVFLNKVTTTSWLASGTAGVTTA